MGGGNLGSEQHISVMPQTISGAHVKMRGGGNFDALCVASLGKIMFFFPLF